MTKERILYVAVLLVTLAAFGAVYQFYFKGKLAEYARDEEYKIALEGALTTLETTFQKTPPLDFTRLWSSRVQPWREELRDRSIFFSFGDWYTHEPVPATSSVIVLTWYDKATMKMLESLYAKVRDTPGLIYFPPDVRPLLEVATTEEWTGKNITEQDLNRALNNLAFGSSVLEMLLDSQVKQINDIKLWPRRTERSSEKLLNLQTIGISFTMSTRAFVEFVEKKLRLAEQFFTVDGMSIYYPYVGQQYEPEVQVEMLFTMARFSGNIGDEVAAETAAPGPGGGAVLTSTPGVAPNVTELMAEMAKRRAALAPQVEEPGIFGKAWKLFKRYILYMN